MTRDDIRNVLLAGLQRIAPEIDPASLRDDVPIRDQIDLDSMDLLNLMIGLHDALGVDVPEADYSRLSTLDRAVSYLQERLSSAPTGA